MGRNRLGLEEVDSSTTIVDTFPIEFFGHRKDSYGLETFVTEFRPVLGNFLVDVLRYNTDIDAILEDSINQFRASKQTQSWHKTVNYRCVLGKILVEVMHQHDFHRITQRESLAGKKHIFDLGSGNIVKQLSMAWRKHIVSESWQRLRHKELQSRRPYYSVLQRRYEKPWLSNGRLLLDLRSVFKMTPTKQAFRVFLHRCEQRFARNIVTTVAETIHMPNSNAVCQELTALDLIHFWERLATEPATAKLARN